MPHERRPPTIILEHVARLRVIQSFRSARLLRRQDASARNYRGQTFATRSVREQRLHSVRLFCENLLGHLDSKYQNIRRLGRVTWKLLHDEAPVSLLPLPGTITVELDTHLGGLEHLAGGEHAVEQFEHALPLQFWEDIPDRATDDFALSDEAFPHRIDQSDDMRWPAIDGHDCRGTVEHAQQPFAFDARDRECGVADFRRPFLSIDVGIRADPLGNPAVVVAAWHGTYDVPQIFEINAA